MTEAGRRLLAGAAETLAFAKGDEPAARLHINGHTYVPESAVAQAVEAERERIAEQARGQHDKYMNDAGWFRNESGKWELRIRFDPEHHNGFVAKANALHAFAASIRSTPSPTTTAEA